MSNRERWVIYPLLFFSLALAAKSQLDQVLRLETEQIVCRELSVVDREGQIQLKLAGDRQGGMLAMLDRQGAATVVLNTSSQGEGQVLVAGAKQLNAIELLGTPAGGQIRFSGKANDPVIVLGYPTQAPAGLTAQHDNVPIEQGATVWGVPLTLPNANADGSADASADAK